MPVGGPYTLALGTREPPGVVPQYREFCIPLRRVVLFHYPFGFPGSAAHVFSVGCQVSEVKDVPGFNGGVFRGVFNLSGVFSVPLSGKDGKAETSC